MISEDGCFGEQQIADNKVIEKEKGLGKTEALLFMLI